MLNGKKEFEALLAQIGSAYACSDLNGYELGQLDNIQRRLLEFGATTKISNKERAELDRIFIKAGVYPAPRT
jgi:hypothetical protein